MNDRGMTKEMTQNLHFTGDLRGLIVEGPELYWGHRGLIIEGTVL